MHHIGGTIMKLSIIVLVGALTLGACNSLNRLLGHDSEQESAGVAGIWTTTIDGEFAHLYVRQSGRSVSSDTEFWINGDRAAVLSGSVTGSVLRLSGTTGTGCAVLWSIAGEVRGPTMALQIDYAGDSTENPCCYQSSVHGSFIFTR